MRIANIQHNSEFIARASNRDGKRYEFVDGKLAEKQVGVEALFIASRIAGILNSSLYPKDGVAVVGAMIWCFGDKEDGRKPEVVFVKSKRLPDGRIPDGDLFIAPDLVTEVLSPTTRAIDLQNRLDDYLSAGIPIVWIVNPDRRTIRIYCSDGRTRLFEENATIEHEPVWSHLQFLVRDVFPVG